MMRTASVALFVALMIPYGVFGQTSEILDDFDFARLAHPTVARQLNLSDEQRVEVGRLLAARTNALTVASDEQRAQVIANSDRELWQLLSGEQRQVLRNIDQAARLRFSFDAQKWSDVLQWVAEQADMTLVYDRIPDQKLSYRDSREYSVGEAIDLLNGILLSKGFTLIRRDKLLILAELSEKLPYELLPEVTLEQLPEYGQFELIRMRIPLGTRPVEAVENEIKGVISSFGQVTIMPQSRQLLVTETAGKIAAIDRLVAAIPEPVIPRATTPKKPPQPTLVVYPIRDVDPAAAMASIKNMLADAKISVDRTASTISILATPAEQEAAKAVLEQLMAGSDTQQRARLQAFDVKTDDPDALKNQIQLVAPNSRISFDAANQRLLVFGSPAELTDVAAALKADDQLGNQKTTIVAYPLTEVNEIASVAEMLQTVVPDATVAASTLTSSIVVRASSAEHQQIQELVNQLNSQRRETPALATYPVDAQLQRTAVSSVSALVPEAQVTWDAIGNRLLVRAKPTDQERVRAIIDRLQLQPDRSVFQTYPVDASQQTSLTAALSKVVPDATITWDAANERLVVFATAAEHPQVKAVIDSLQTDPNKPIWNTYAVDPNHQSSLVTALAKAVPKATVTWDAANERLVVWATAEDHLRIEASIAALEPQQKRQRRSLRVYSFAPHLQERIRALLSTIDGGRTPPEVVDATQPGELAVLAENAQHTRFDELVQQLQRQDQSRNKLTLQAYPVISAAPDSLQAVVQELFPNTKILVDAEASRLMVWASEDNQRAIRQAVEQLDVARSPMTLEQLKAYDTPGLEIENLTTTLSQQFPSMVLSHDSSNNKILAWGTERSHEQLNETIRQLIADHPPRDTSIQIYPTSPRTPGQIIPLLADTVPDARLTADVESGSVVARGTADEHRLIREALEKLPSLEDGPRQHELVAYDVAPQEIANVVLVLDNVTPQATVTQANDSRKIFVWGTAAEHQRIRQALATLDRDAVDTEPSVRVYRIAPGIIQSLVEVIGVVVPEARITNQQVDQLTILAAAEDHQRITDLAKQLDTEIEFSETLVRTYALEGISANDLTELLNADLRSGTNVAVSADGDRLVVRAIADEHERLALIIPQLIEQLAAETPSQEVRTYALEGASGADVVEMIGADLGPANSATVSADGLRLIVRAGDAEHQRLATLIPNIIEQLVKESMPGTVRVYPLNQTSGPQLVELLSPDLPAKASATISQDGDRLIVRAPVAEHERIAALVSSLIDQLGVEEQPINHVYRPQVAELETVADVFDDLFPSLKIALDESGQFVAVTALPSEHQQLQVLFEALEEGLPARPTPKSYRLSNADAEVVADSVRTLLRRKRSAVAISVDANANTLLVVAPQREHVLIGRIIAEFDAPQNDLEGDYTTELYGSSELSPRTLERILRTALSKDAEINADPISDRIIVRASAENHEIARATVARLSEQLPQSDDRISRIYHVESTDPEIVENIFNDVAPRAGVQADGPTRTVTVTASVAEHKRLAELLQQLETGLSSTPIPRTYTIDQSDPGAVYQSLLELFGDEDVAINWQPGSESLLVVTTEDRHEMVDKVIGEFNTSDGLASQDDLQVYPLRDIDGNAAREALNSLLSAETPSPRIEFDQSNNQMLALATSKQHDMIRDALGRMKRERRELAFFDLRANDALSLEMAIEGLFRDLPENAAPQVESNIDNQQLIVRATRDQMQKVRDLLTRMGESVFDPNRDVHRRVRSIPFYGNIDNTMRRMKEIWPQFHTNELRIIYPADYDGGQLLKRLPTSENLQPTQRQRRDVFQSQPSVPPSPSPTPLPNDETQKEASQPAHTGQPATAELQEQESKGTEHREPRTDENQDQPPPIVIIPGEGQLTILSDDPEALNEFESLMRLFAAPERSASNDVAIYGLRNASAVDTAQLLEDFFDAIPEWSRIGTVIVVPDARLNALVVHGSRSGREVVKEILTVLDAGEDESRTKFNKPRIVPVRNASATRVLTILQTIYDTQLTTGSGRRKQIEIPTGMDPDVAAVLEQINATAAGPLLTLEVDTTTNSIIILGPPQLAEEVTDLIRQLDQGSLQADTRGIRVISLKNMRSQLLMDLLDELVPTE